VKYIALLRAYVTIAEREERFAACDALLRIEPPDIRKAYAARIPRDSDALETTHCGNDIWPDVPQMLERVAAANLALDAEKPAQLLGATIGRIGALLNRIRREQRQNPVGIARIDPPVVLANETDRRLHSAASLRARRSKNIARLQAATPLLSNVVIQKGAFGYE
jgi:hypothetical protein